MREALLTQEKGYARKGAASAAARPMSKEEMEKLASLGYLSAGGGVTTDAEGVPKGPDPKTMMPLQEKFIEASELMGQGKVAEALPIVEGIIAKDPKNPMFRSKKARALVLMGRTDEAKKEVRAIIAMHPEHAISYSDLASLEEMTGEPLRAVETLRKLRGVDPRWVGVTEKIADLLVKAGKPGEAIEELRVGAKCWQGISACIAADLCRSRTFNC